MPYAERTFECAGCGMPTSRRAAADSQVRCIDCAIERATMNMLQLRAKKGAFYDKWAARLALAMTLEVRHSEVNKVSERRG